MRVCVLARTCVVLTSVSLLCSNVSSNGLKELTFSSMKQAVASIQTLDVGRNSLMAFPDTTKMPNLKVLIVTSNNITKISSAEPSQLLRKLHVDWNPLPPEFPEWVYTQTETSGLDFSALPLCLRGWVRPSDSALCKKCDIGSYALTGNERQCRKDGCGEDFFCNGGFNIVPKVSNWRAPPYFRANVGIGYVSDTLEVPGGCNGARCTVSSNSVDAVVRVFACPNSDACQISNDTGLEQYPLCADGYHGPLCSLCEAGYVWSEGHKCSRCKGGADKWLHLGIAGGVIVSVVAYLVLIARPLLHSSSLSTLRWSGSSRLARVFTRFKRALGIAVAAYLVIVNLALTMYEWYNDEFGDQEELLAAMFRILIGFAQVIGNLSGIRLSWPPEFYTLARWFDFARFSFDVPSVACAIEQSSVGYTFYTRHLLYTIGPLVLILLLALPSLWARLRRLPAATIADLDNRRVRWTLFAVFVLYPKVGPPLAMSHCHASPFVRAWSCDSPLVICAFEFPPICTQVSQIAISARICKNVGTEILPESLLQYDSRVDCLSAEYASYSVYFWAMAVLWPIGYPLVLLLLLKIYRVPEIAARKIREAKIRAFVVHSMAKASEIGIQRTEAIALGSQSATPLDDDDNRPRRASSNRSRRLSIGRRRTLQSAENEGPLARMQSYANLEDIPLPVLQFLGKAHGLNETSATVLMEALTTRMQELLDLEAVVPPLVAWDEESPDAEERLALTHLESLIGAYEVQYWWYAHSP
jgi:hypothetical protein